MRFYGVIWGYFDQIKRPLKLMPRPWASGSRQILIGLLKFKGLQIYGPSKLAVKKDSRPFGFEATFFAKLLLLIWSSGDPGSNPGCCKHWAPSVLQPLNKSSFLEPHLKALTLICMEKNIQGGSIILGHIMNTQSTLISNHKRVIFQEWVRRTVNTELLCPSGPLLGISNCGCLTSIFVKELLYN